MAMVVFYLRFEPIFTADTHFKWSKVTLNKSSRFASHVYFQWHIFYYAVILISNVESSNLHFPERMTKSGRNSNLTKNLSVPSKKRNSLSEKLPRMRMMTSWARWRKIRIRSRINRSGKDPARKFKVELSMLINSWSLFFTLLPFPYFSRY